MSIISVVQFNVLHDPFRVAQLARACDFYIGCYGAI